MTVHERAVGATVEWFTPPQIFDALGLGFDLDPASPESGPVPWVPALKFYSKRDDGLRQPWSGLVWLNPPYGPDAVPFIDRLIDHGRGVLLMPSRTETRIFQRAAARAPAVCFLRDRLHFIREDGFQARSSFASVLMAFGSVADAALRRTDMGWLA